MMVFGRASAFCGCAAFPFFAMNCLNPIRIYNKYVDEYMFVPCRHCDACLIKQANVKASDLALEISRCPYCYMATLTYNNDSLPVILDGDNRIIRGCSQPFGEILEYLPKRYSLHGCKVPKNAIINDCVGVFYHADLRNFFKKLRNYYERNYKTKFRFKYFASAERECESERPHYHVIFYGWTDEYKRLLPAIIDSWSFATWCKLDLSKSFEVCNSTTAFYVASYVNCGSRRAGIFLEPFLKQKTFRSKNISFGIDDEVSKDIEKIIRCGFVDNYFLSTYQRPFERRLQARIDNISTRLVQSRLFSSYYSRPSFCNHASFNTFSRRGGEVYQLYRRYKSKVKSSDYKFMLGYRRYLACTGYVDNWHVFQIYLQSFWSMYNFYQSLRLKYQMQDYDPQKPLEYALKQYNSFSDDVGRRFIQLRKLGSYEKIYDKVFHPLDSESVNQIQGYVEKYKSKLLKKHLANEINF